MGQGRGGGLDRREVMRTAIMLVGGAVAAKPLATFAQLAEARPFFDESRFALLDRVSEAIIPQTDTPGASAAGVPRFIDGMMAEWASEDTRAIIAAALAQIDAGAMAKTGSPLTALTDSQRRDLLREHDAAAMASGDPGWRELKELVLMGYYLSEAGATEELRYELAPGVWEASVAITPDTRAWAV